MKVLSSFDRSPFTPSDAARASSLEPENSAKESNGEQWTEDGWSPKTNTALTFIVGVSFLLDSMGDRVDDFNLKEVGRWSISVI